MTFHPTHYPIERNLPLVDVSALRGNDLVAKKRVASELGEAARDIGFFRIRGHGIARALIEDTYAAAKRFFAQPETTKHRYYIGYSPNHRGYVPFTEKGDYADEMNRNYEAFDMGLDLPEDDPDFLAGNLLLGPNVWPDMPGFRKTVSRYYAEVSRLGQLICSALELHLGLPPAALTGHMTKPISQLRLLHYIRPPSTLDTGSINMGAHTDYECLTLLHTRNEGLQVMSHDDKWIDVPVDRDAYVINIGDMLEAWSNGIFRSTPHRVLNLSPERFSIPYFVAANHDAIIRPFPQLVRPGETPRYPAFRAGAHLERMLQRDFPYLRDRQHPARPIGAVEQGHAVNNPFETRIDRSKK